MAKPTPVSHSWRRVSTRPEAGGEGGLCDLEAEPARCRSVDDPRHPLEEVLVGELAHRQVDHHRQVGHEVAPRRQLPGGDLEHPLAEGTMSPMSSWRG